MPTESRRRTLRVIALFVVIHAVVFACLHLIDKPINDIVVDQDVSQKDWNRLLRSAGSLWPWAYLAAGFLLIDWPKGNGGRRHRSFTRAVLLFVPAATAGGLAELMKIFIRRERPNAMVDYLDVVPQAVDGAYVQRPWSHLMEGGGMGLPSSHTAIVFAATMMLTYMYPRALPVCGVIAIGRGIVRVLNHNHSHFVTDVYLGAVIGTAVGWLFWRWHLYNQRRIGDT